MLRDKRRNRSRSNRGSRGEDALIKLHDNRRWGVLVIKGCSQCWCSARYIAIECDNWYLDTWIYSDHTVRCEIRCCFWYFEGPTNTIRISGAHYSRSRTFTHESYFFPTCLRTKYVHRNVRRYARTHTHPRTRPTYMRACVHACAF